MIEGSEKLDISRCKKMKPIAGYRPGRELRLVRNPSYDPSTDSSAYRENNVDGFVFTVEKNERKILRRLRAGKLDGLMATVSASAIIAEYGSDPALEDRLHAKAADRVLYITMNLTQPPFDDVHVRKAANLVLDKAAIREAWGGAIAGDIATHVVPPTMTGGEPAGYDPYATANHEGDLALAMAEIQQSKYYGNPCDLDNPCRVTHITRDFGPWLPMRPVIEEGLNSILAPIGFVLETVPLDTGAAYEAIGSVPSQVPVGSNPGWGKDYGDPSTFHILFVSWTLGLFFNINYSLVGLTPEQAAAFESESPGTIWTWNTDGVPSVDAEFDVCDALTGGDRTACWIELDMKIREEVVPWVPYLWGNHVTAFGPAVVEWEFDQFAADTAWSKVQVDATKQRGPKE